MKYDDLMTTLRYHEKLENCIFFEITLIHEDFNSIIMELGVSADGYKIVDPIGTLVSYGKCIVNKEEQKIIKINEVEILSSSPTAFLIKNRACFSRPSVQTGVLFTHVDVLSEKEFVIKELLE